MRKKDNTVRQPDEATEKQLNDILEDKKDVVTVRKSKYRIGWMKNGTKRKVTDIIKSEQDDLKVNSKCAAAMVLNGYWGIRLLWWALWRWFYYVKQYSDNELLPLIELAKKKMEVDGYCLATIYLTEIKDTVMAMTREEVNRIRAEQAMVRRGQSGKNTEN